MAVVDDADNIGMENLPGMHSATMLFGLGLPSEGIIRGLMLEIGLTYDEAALTTSMAELEHSNANHGRSVPSCVRVGRRTEPSHAYDTDQTTSWSSADAPTAAQRALSPQPTRSPVVASVSSGSDVSGPAIRDPRTNVRKRSA